MAIAYANPITEQAEALPPGLLPLYGRLSRRFGDQSVTEAPGIIWALNEQVSLEVTVHPDEFDEALDFVAQTIRLIKQEYGELYSVMLVPEGVAA
jgi:hypothetical protein